MKDEERKSDLPWHYSIIVYLNDDVLENTKQVLNLSLSAEDYLVFRNTLLQQWFFSDKIITIEQEEVLKSKEKK